MFAQVGRGTVGDLGAILPRAQDHIAVPAEQTPNRARLMIMVNVQRGPGRLSPTNGALVSLSLKGGLVLLNRDAKELPEPTIPQHTFLFWVCVICLAVLGFHGLSSFRLSVLPVFFDAPLVMIPIPLSSFLATTLTVSVFTVAAPFLLNVAASVVSVGSPFLFEIARLGKVFGTSGLHAVFTVIRESVVTSLTPIPIRCGLNGAASVTSLFSYNRFGQGKFSLHENESWQGSFGRRYLSFEPSIF